MPTLHVVAVVLLVLLLGDTCSAEKPSSKSVKDVLKNATTFELYSLDPSKKDEEKGFHGRAILGKTLVKNANVRKEIVASLYEAIAQSDGNAARCFIPRHGIRATHKDKIVDVVICFECYRVKFFVKNAETTETLTRTPEPLFDKVLKEAGVPLAPKAGK